MAERKRRTTKVEVEKPAKVVNKTGKVFKNEVIYSEPSKDSPFIGAILAGELVKIDDNSLSSEGWIKITTNVTKVTGYINSRSII
ncbi:MAG: SH3 domain-containing protein [Pseudobutyrivibrio sp.]|nr:SH3 domain-containing protein [Pseudobutyrivibrio sp.]